MCSGSWEIPIFSLTFSHFTPCFLLPSTVLDALWLRIIPFPILSTVRFFTRSLAVVIVHSTLEFSSILLIAQSVLREAVPIHNNWWFSPIFFTFYYSIPLVNVAGYPNSVVCTERKVFSFLPAMYWWTIEEKKLPSGKEDILQELSGWSMHSFPVPLQQAHETVFCTVVSIVSVTTTCSWLLKIRFFLIN